jgi:acetyltransferase-like isoleucine patch superfamily enzyme
VEGPALILGRDLWVSSGMLAEFEKVAAGADAPLRLARDAEGPGNTADPLERLPRRDGKILFDLWFIPAGVTIEVGEELPASLESARGVDVETKVHEMDLAVDAVSNEGSASMTLKFAGIGAAPVSHWVELQRANLLALGTHALERGPFWGGLGLLWAVIKARSINPFRVAAKVTICGRNCLIHPSAVVEGCVLGDNVKVDAGAVLRGCVLGDNVKVGPLALGEFSVIGDNAELQKQCTATVCVIYPGARVGGVAQLTVVGRDARFKLGAITTDMNPTGAAVRVMTPLGLSSVDYGYLGCCLGHRSFVGSGIWIAPGRIIQADRMILREAEQMVLK